MENLESKILALLDELEIELKECVVMDGDEIEYFDDPAMEALCDKEDEIAVLIDGALPELIKAKVELSTLPSIALCPDISDLYAELDQYKERYPYLQEFTESLDSQDVVWQPAYVALRDYFDLEGIQSISSEYEFAMATLGYLKLIDVFSNFILYDTYDSCEDEVNELKSSRFASPGDIDALNELIDLLTEPAPMPYTPTPIVFEGSTGGLEPQFMEWVAKHFSNDSLFDDEDFDLFAPDEPEDPNMENLKAAWLAADPSPPTAFENYLWIAIDSNAPIDYDFNEIPIFFQIHQLSQIIRDPSKARLSHLPESMESYKITMYRTGERHEYNAEMDRSLLALQILLFHQSSEVPIENIEAEVHWVRLSERAYPLVGLNAEELEYLSQTYLEAQ